MSAERGTHMETRAEACAMDMDMHVCMHLHTDARKCVSTDTHTCMHGQKHMCLHTYVHACTDILVILCLVLQGCHRKT